jgi:hypothetical protein
MHAARTLQTTNLTLAVVQAKYRTAHTSQSPISFAGQAALLTGTGTVGTRPEVVEAQNHIKDAIAQGNQVEFAYVTQSRFRDARQKGRLVIDWQKAGRRSRLVFLDMQDIAEIVHSRAIDLPDEYGKMSFSLRLDVPVQKVSVADADAYVCSVPLNSLAEFARSAQPYLYVSNIRQYLSRTAVNKLIERTLDESPELFWAYNNGLTIMCKTVTIEGLTAVVKGPQLLNGCQTACSLVRYFKTLRKSERDQFRGSVLVRLLTENGTVKKDNVTRYTNSQNSVRGKDFLALDDFHRRLHEAFEREGYYYEVQRGAFSAVDITDRGKYGQRMILGRPCFFRFIPSLEAVQAYATAFCNLPHIAYSSPSDLLPGGSEYSKVFPGHLEPLENWERFLYAFAVGEYAEKYLGYGRGGKGFRRFGKWFFVYVAFTLLRELLKSVTGKDQPLLSIDGKTLAAVLEVPDIVDGVLGMSDGVVDQYLVDSRIRQLTDEHTNDQKFLQAGCAEIEPMAIIQYLVRAAVDKDARGVRGMVKALLP